MEALLRIIDHPVFVYLVVSVVVIVGIAYYWALKADKVVSSRRLAHRRIVPMEKLSRLDQETLERTGDSVAKILADKTNKLYAASDPDSTKKIKMQMIRAGYFQPDAAGMFLIMRPIFAALLGVSSFVYTKYFAIDWQTSSIIMATAIGVGFGYYVPQIYVGRKASKIIAENRSAFPDFMDLMIVCVEAGLSMEAAITRISSEVEKSYPNLSIHLSIASLEVRSGRTLEEALQSMAERINLDEVKSFATLLKQSRELGTSLASALKVYSDDMRDKRMSLAEEKAHALPAKMSVPVTMCILPVILIIAALPVAFKISSGG